MGPFRVQGGCLNTKAGTCSKVERSTVKNKIILFKKYSNFSFIMGSSD
jgi:hypothetical protein